MPTDEKPQVSALRLKSHYSCFPDHDTARSRKVGSNGGGWEARVERRTKMLPPLVLHSIRSQAGGWVSAINFGLFQGKGASIALEKPTKGVTAGGD